MNLFIQIPCFNEEDTLGEVIAALPRDVPGCSAVRTLVIDDGSRDGTLQLARKLGVDYIVVNHRNLGLARSFARGLEAAAHLGADVVVNTDGDHQYPGSDVPSLVAPVVEHRADLVVGARDIWGHPEFPWGKKVLQRLGSRVVGGLTGTRIPDATSGFRAFSRTATLQLSVMSSFSYTLETLIQAARMGLGVEAVPIGVNPKKRPSRLFRSIPQFIWRQVGTIVKMFLFYFPMRFFTVLAAVCLLLALAGAANVAYYLWWAPEALQKFRTGSGVFMLFFALSAVVMVTLGMLGSVLSGIRFLVADVRWTVREQACAAGHWPEHLTVLASEKPGAWQTQPLEGGEEVQYRTVDSRWLRERT